MKQTIKLTESELHGLIKESVKRILREGIYDYPDGIDHLIFLSENDRECYDFLSRIRDALKKKADKGVELEVGRLADSSIMKKYQQLVYRKFKNEQRKEGVYVGDPSEFRYWVSAKLVDTLDEWYR